MSVGGLWRTVSGPDSRLSVATVGSVGTSVGGAAGRFLLQIALTTLLGTASYGVFVTLRTWGELLATLPDRGNRGSVVRFLPRYRDDGEGASYQGLIRYALRTTIAGGVALAALAFVVFAVVSNEPLVALIAAMATVPAWAVLRLLQGILQAQHRFVQAHFFVQILQPLLLAIIVGGLWLVAEVDLESAMAALLVSIVAAGLVSGIVAGRAATAAVGRPTPTLHRELWSRTANHFYLGQLAIAVISMADVLILSLFVSSSQVALYSIASRIAILGRVINSGLESVVSPRIAEAWNRDDRGAIQQLVQTTIGISTVPTVAFAVLVTLFRDQILGLVGDDYRSAATVMVILLVGNVVNALTGPSGYVVSLTDNERVHARIMSATAAGLVIACLVVAEPAGVVGVAIARTVANAAWNLALVIVARRRLGVRCYPTLSAISP